MKEMILCAAVVLCAGSVFAVTAHPSPANVSEANVPAPANVFQANVLDPAGLFCSPAMTVWSADTLPAAPSMNLIDPSCKADCKEDYIACATVLGLASCGWIYQDCLAGCPSV